jgi:hypothetical protein
MQSCLEPTQISTPLHNYQSASDFRILHRRLIQQRQEELEPGSIGGIGVELDSGGKQC